MKAIVVALLLIASVVIASGAAVPAGFNQTLYVNPSQTTDYSLFSNPLLGGSLLDVYVSSTFATNASSNVIVSTFANLPSITSGGSASTTINGGYPAGYAAFGASVGSISLGSVIGAGLSIFVSSDIAGKSTTNVTLLMSPVITTQLNASLVYNFRPLTFNAATQTYSELPSNQYTATPSGGIAIFTSTSISLVLAVYNPVPVVLNIANNAIVSANVVANRSVSFAINSGTNTALNIYNLTAAAGTIAVAVATNVSTSTVAAGQALISNIYSFTHSAGGNAVYSAQLSYDASQSGISLNANLVANLAWYWYTNNQWVQQSSSVNGNVVTSVVSHFSSWSVQSNNGTATSTASATPVYSSASGLKVNSIFGGFLKCLF